MRNKSILVWIFLSLLCFLVVLAGLMTGPAKLHFTELINAFQDPDSQNGRIIFSLRMPRILMALLSGAILTLAGFFMQALVRNPLADPYILGLSSGAGFGVNLVILGLIPLTGYTAFTYPIAAITGGGISLFILMLLARPSGREDSFRLLLAGIAVSSLCTALTGLLIYLYAEDDQVRKFMFWNFGSFAFVHTEGLLPSALALLLGWLGGWILAPSMDILALGEKESNSLGLDSARLKVILILLSTLMVGAGIGFTGPIGFVGMMIPHFSRAIFGDLHRKNIWIAPLGGGIYLAFCDLLSQWIYPPAGLPVGVLTALLGVPFFLFLLGKQKKG